MSLNQLDFRKAMGSFATGVTVITIDDGGEVHGMTANAFTSVSLDPMLVLVCVDHRARTHAHLQSRKRFGVNVLASHQKPISEYYAKSVERHQNAEAVGARFERTQHAVGLSAFVDEQETIRKRDEKSHCREYMAVGPAQASQRQTGVPASVTLAQAILESGWGDSHMSCQNWK